MSRNKLGNINWFDPAVPVARVLPGGITGPATGKLRADEISLSLRYQF